MKNIEAAYFTGGILKDPIEDWKIELTKFIREAHLAGKHIKSMYQQITFSPMGLAGCLIKGQFVWGVVNFCMIEPVLKPDFGDDHYYKTIGITPPAHSSPPPQSSKDDPKQS